MQMYFYLEELRFVEVGSSGRPNLCYGHKVRYSFKSALSWFLRRLSVDRD